MKATCQPRVMEIEAENRMSRLWHTNCQNWLPESRGGVNTSAVMRYVQPDDISTHDDGSPLYLAECLHCGGKAYIGLDKQRRIIVRQAHEAEAEERERQRLLQCQHGGMGHGGIGNHP